MNKAEYVFDKIESFSLRFLDKPSNLSRLVLVAFKHRLIRRISITVGGVYDIPRFVLPLRQRVEDFIPRFVFCVRYWVAVFSTFEICTKN